MRGKLIVFEGGEGSGKTTQIARTHHWLIESGWLATLQRDGLCSELIVTREPGGTELCREMRQILLNPKADEPMVSRAELLLYAADRAQHVEAFLKPQLEAGALILCDRYTDSTVAYQGYGRGLDLTLIHQLNQIATGGLVSDLTLWLKLDPEAGLARMRQRGNADRIEQADLDFHRRVTAGFQALAEANPDRMVAIAADQSEPEVAHAIQTLLTEQLCTWYPQSLPPSSVNPRQSNS